MYKYFLIAVCGFLVVSCGSDNDEEDRLKEIAKDGSIETKVSVKHLGDTADVLTTSHTVWKNSAVVKTIINNDTVPSLGKKAVLNDKDSTVNINKDYDIYITVKE